MVGQLSTNNKAPLTSLGRDLYFLKACQLPLSTTAASWHLLQADTSKFTANPRTILDKLKDVDDKLNINTDVFNVLSSAASSKALKDFYLIGLWSYCEGEIIGPVEKITYCSSPNTQFSFDPVEVWGLKNTSVQNMLGDDLQKGLDKYRGVMGRMSSVFIVTTILIASEILMSFYAISSRLGSMWTCILAAVSSSFDICI